MREILFRGKRIDNGEWVQGFYMHHSNVAHYIIDIQYGGYEDIDGGFFVPRWYAVNPNTIGEYTGLTDKNGKRIFEGDVLEYNDGYDYFKGEVVFEAGSFGMGTYETIGIPNSRCDNYISLWDLFWGQKATDELEIYYCEVIGNIHNNSELLKGENNV